MDPHPARSSQYSALPSSRGSSGQQNTSPDTHSSSLAADFNPTPLSVGPGGVSRSTSPSIATAAVSGVATAAAVGLAGGAASTATSGAVPPPTIPPRNPQGLSSDVSGSGGGGGGPQSTASSNISSISQSFAETGEDPTDDTDSMVGEYPSEAASPDIIQHCLLFPTYATRHSRSGSKDPLDWNVRVRGWAFSKRTNRRKRLVMSVARKLAGVTKDNEVYKNLESRFGMFLATNTNGARFSIQCVGLTNADHMELAGDPSSHTNHAANELMKELHTSENDEVVAQAAEEKADLRNALTRGDFKEPGSPLMGVNDIHPFKLAEQEAATSSGSSGNNNSQSDVAKPTPPVIPPRTPSSAAAAAAVLLANGQSGIKSDSPQLRATLSAAHSTASSPSLTPARTQSPVERLVQVVNDKVIKSPKLGPNRSAATSPRVSPLITTTAATPPPSGTPTTATTSTIQPITLAQLQKTDSNASNDSSSSSQPDGSRTHRWVRGTASVMKDAFKKYKPIIANQVSQYSASSVETIGHMISASTSRGDENGHGSAKGNGSGSDSETFVDRSGDAKAPLPRSPNLERTDTAASVTTQSLTYVANLGLGDFPTVEISSKPGGHFDGTLRVSYEHLEQHRRDAHLDQYPKFLKLQAFNEHMPDHCFGAVNLIDPEGISVISDIDDTIKETNVLAGARTILRNTFLKDTGDVPGMAHAYHQWWRQGAVFHYVSNSPWQLIPMLLDFFHKHNFPHGSAHLRLHDSVLKTYLSTPGESKRRCIKEILADFPDRKFVLVGDSGEIDMEIYTEIALAHPNQILKVFIRDITTARLQEMAAKAPPPRSRSLAAILPKGGFGYFGRQNSQSSIQNLDSSSAAAVVNSAPNGGNPVSDGQPTGATASTTSVATLVSLDQEPSKIGTGVVSASNVAKAIGSPEQAKTDLLSDPSATVSTKGTPLARTPVREDTAAWLAMDPSQPPSSAVTNAMTTGHIYTSKNLNSTSPPNSSPAPSLTASPRQSPTLGPSTPSTKTPLEIWQDRVEACRQQLPHGLLTLFTSATELEQCERVQEGFRSFVGVESDATQSTSVVAMDADVTTVSSPVPAVASPPQAVEAF